MINRHIDLLNLLMEQDDYKPASFFSKALKVSTKTIYSDINELEIFLNRFDVDLVKIPRSGIILDAGSEKKKEIRSYIKKLNKEDKYSIDYRRIQIGKRLLIESQVLSIEGLSTEFIVSKTSIYNDIDFISKHIFKSEKFIIVDGSGIHVKGSEKEIQKETKNFLSHYFKRNIDGYLSNTDLINEFFETNILKLVEYIFDKNSELMRNISQYYMQSLKIALLILFSRIQRGFHLEKENGFLFNNIRYMEIYVVANNIVEIADEKCNLKFLSSDIEYLCKVLFAHKITAHLNIDDMKDLEIVKELVRKIEFIEKVTFDENSSLYQSLLYHVPAMIVRLKSGIRIQNPLLQDIKNHYARLFTEIWYAMSFLESKYDITLNDDEVSLILVYFQIELDKISKSKNIIIICPYGNSSSQLILSRVQRFLPERDNIEISTLARLNDNKCKNVDLIITPIEIDVKDVPCVKVSPLVSDEDMIKILDVYSSCVVDGKRSMQKNISLIEAPTVSKFLEDDFVYLQEQISSREECLDKMISRLEKLGYVNNGFRESVINREKMGTTSLETGVALPHGDSETIKQSTISIMTVKNQIRWGQISVKLVIMVTLAKEDIDLFKDVIMELYQIIEKKELVDEIVNIKDIDTIKEIFRE